MKTFIFVNGILTSPGDAHGWTDKAVTWVHRRSVYRAEKFEYFTPVVTRRLFQRRHAGNLSELLSNYGHDDVVLVGHSNGCDLICSALKMSGVLVQSVLFFSPATDADFYKNGMNERLSSNVKHVTVFTGGKDWAMGLAKVSQVFKSVGLGYGTLGLNGPKNVAVEVQDRVLHIHEPEYGHSDWFAADKFEKSMRYLGLE